METRDDIERDRDKFKHQATVYKALSNIFRMAAEGFAKRIKQMSNPMSTHIHYTALQEQHIMELAAISTASIQNTADSVQHRIERTNSYWTQAYADVCAAVDREMRERERAEKAEYLCAITQKQVERMMDARDAEKILRNKAEKERDEAYLRNKENVEASNAMIAELQAKCAEMREAQVKFPDNLSALTVGLVLRFAQAMADKLSAAQIKHGYGDGWAETTHEWPIPECHEALMSHLKKGDPVDVANFCAFLWYHKIGTTDCGKGWRSPEDYAALEAKCAEMRDSLLRVSKRSWFQDKMQKEHEHVRHALSSDCGKGWRSPEEYAALEKQVEIMRQRLTNAHDRLLRGDNDMELLRILKEGYGPPQPDAQNEAVTGRGGMISPHP